jgi:hypothetical protein
MSSPLSIIRPDVGPRRPEGRHNENDGQACLAAIALLLYGIVGVISFSVQLSRETDPLRLKNLKVGLGTAVASLVLAPLVCFSLSANSHRSH